MEVKHRKRSAYEVLSVSSTTQKLSYKTLPETSDTKSTPKEAYKTALQLGLVEKNESLDLRAQQRYSIV
jgi:hypothetical protein